MAKMLGALLQLQLVERQLAHVRGRLKSRQNAVAAQQHRIDQLQEEHKALLERATNRRMSADRHELDLKTREQQVLRLRGTLNTVKTNKEYSAILTQINTLKADNAKIEEEALRIIQEVEAIKATAGEAKAKVEAEEQRMQEIQKTSSEEVARLTKMLEDLTVRRAEAAKAVPTDALAYFDRIAEQYEGEAMAVIEIHGKKPPHDYICGGCYMGLNAEHANALRVRDEIRTCDNCKRILYLEPEAEKARSR